MGDSENKDKIIWPKYVGVKDDGVNLEYKLETSPGVTKEVKVLKRMKGLFRDFDDALYDTAVLRDFDFETSQSLIFVFRGGIGDIVVALDAIVGLKAFLKKHSKQEFEFVASALTYVYDESLRRLITAMNVFDKIYIKGVDKAPELKFQPAFLDANPHRVRWDHFAIGTYWDMFWAIWGIPSRFQPAELENERTFKNKLNEEFAAARKQAGLPESKKYVLLNPESAFESEKKKWPVSNWSYLVEQILKNTDLDVVFMCSKDGELKKEITSRPRVIVYDHEKDPGSKEYIRLFSMVENSRCVVSLDSGPAHVAGFLKTPCITLWGPTYPAYAGNRNNINVRASICPPCHGRERSILCQENVCMKEIKPDSVWRILNDALHSKYFPR